jgi:acyl carrier protein
MSEAAVIAAIAAELTLAPGDLRPEAEFDRDYGIDSLDFVRLVMAVEVAACVRIDDKAAAKVRSVGELLELARRSPPGPPTGSTRPAAGR